MTLRFQNLSKAFGRKKVLDRLSHAFDRGIVVLRGPNGIGKSTLLSILAGVLQPDAGEIEIAGYSLGNAPLQAKARLSYVADSCNVYPFMTGRELLEFVAHAKGTTICPDVKAMVEEFSVASHLDTLFGQMSLGTQKKIMLASGWIGQPSVILMDEPLNGLDSASREVLISRFGKMGQEVLVLISTHDAEFAKGVQAEILEFSKLQEHFS